MRNKKIAQAGTSPITTYSAIVKLYISSRLSCSAKKLASQLAALSLYNRQPLKIDRKIVNWRTKPNKENHRKIFQPLKIEFFEFCSNGEEKLSILNLVGEKI